MASLTRAIARENYSLVLTKALSAGSCFTDRPYCAASPQASESGAARPKVLRHQENYKPKPPLIASCIRSPACQEPSLTEYLVKGGRGPV